MIKLNDIIKNVDLKQRGSQPNLTYCNAILYFINCIETGFGEEAKLKYQVARFYKYVQDHKCANNSFLGWSRKIPVIADNMDRFNEFVKTIDKKDSNYIDLQKYVKTK